MINKKPKIRFLNPSRQTKTNIGGVETNNRNLKSSDSAEHPLKKSFPWRKIATRILPIFLVILLIVTISIAAVPSWRNAFNKFIAKWSPKADVITTDKSCSTTLSASTSSDRNNATMSISGNNDSVTAVIGITQIARWSSTQGPDRCDFFSQGIRAAKCYVSGSIKSTDPVVPDTIGKDNVLLESSGTAGPHEGCKRGAPVDPGTAGTFANGETAYITFEPNTKGGLAYATCSFQDAYNQANWYDSAAVGLFLEPDDPTVTVTPDKEEAYFSESVNFDVSVEGADSYEVEIQSPDPKITVSGTTAKSSIEGEFSFPWTVTAKIGCYTKTITGTTDSVEFIPEITGKVEITSVCATFDTSVFASIGMAYTKPTNESWLTKLTNKAKGKVASILNLTEKAYSAGTPVNNSGTSSTLCNGDLDTVSGTGSTSDSATKSEGTNNTSNKKDSESNNIYITSPCQEVSVEGLAEITQDNPEKDIVLVAAETYTYNLANEMENAKYKSKLIEAKNLKTQGYDYTDEQPTNVQPIEAKYIRIP